jgi:hypothetical protein
LTANNKSVKFKINIKLTQNKMKKYSKKNFFESASGLFYSRFVFKKNLESFIDKMLDKDSEIKEVKKNIEVRLRLREVLAKEYLDKKRKYAQSLSNKEKLFGHWVFDKAKVVEDDPRYLALREIRDGKLRTEAFMLLGMIEKFLGGREVARDLLKECWKGNTFNIDKLRSFFKKDKTDRKLGFYYVKRKIKWYANRSWREVYNTKKRKVEVTWWAAKKGWDQPYKYMYVTVTGWWAHDNDEDNVNTLKGGKSFDSYALGKKGKLRGGGYGDEWLGADFHEALPYIKKELYPEDAKLGPGDRDSGMSPTKEGAILDALVELHKPTMTDKWTVKKDLYKWFTKEKPQNTWFVLPEDKIGLMNQVYGRGCGNYRYRVSGGRIYILAIKDSEFDVNYGIGGYIELKHDSLGEWTACPAKDTASFSKELRKEVLAKMTDKEVKEELEKTEVMQSATVIPGKELSPTKDAMAHILGEKNYKKYGLPANFLYEEKSMYFKKIKEALKKYLIEQGYSEGKNSKIPAFVEARASQVEQDMENYIKDPDGALKDIIKPKTRIRLKVDSENRVSVLLDSKTDRDLLKLREKVIAASMLGESMKEAKSQGRFGRVMTWINARFERFLSKTRLGKYGKGVVKAVAGFATAAFAQLVNLKDLFTGPFKKIAAAAMGALGIGGGTVALVYKGRRLDQVKFDKLVENKSRKLFKKNYKTTRKINLGSGKIEIANGAALTPIPGLHLKVNGKDTTIPSKPGMWGGKEWLDSNGNKVDYKGKKIEIVGHLPSGFKIKRGFVWVK